MAKNEKTEVAAEHESRRVTFTAEKETKNTVKYQEDQVEGQPPVIGTLYVQKWFAGGRKQITVVIS